LAAAIHRLLLRLARCDRLAFGLVTARFAQQQQRVRDCRRSIIWKPAPREPLPTLESDDGLRLLQIVRPRAGKHEGTAARGAAAADQLMLERAGGGRSARPGVTFAGARAKWLRHVRHERDR
jgi:hypothetical protein